MVKDILFICLAVLFWIGCQSSRTLSEGPPNIVLLIADDHGLADLGLLGYKSDVQTPSLDRLAQMAVQFSNAYATSPICSPSRVGLMTGSYHQRQNVFWYGGNGISDPTVPTIAELLQASGFATAYFGKFHYGSRDGDTSHRSFPLNHGYQELFGCNGGRKHYLIHDNQRELAFQEKMRLAESPKQSLKMEGFWRQKSRIDVEGFSTELIGLEGRKFIQRNLDLDQPFFATISFNAVHNFTHQLPEAYLSEHNLNGYHDWDPATESYYDWYVQGRKPNNPEGRAHYLGQLHYLDLEVGKLIGLLEENGALEETVIIYIGDNGGSTQIYGDNSPYAGGKYTMYEGGLRVPFFIAWPKKFRPAKRDNLVSAMDILPTICKMTGVDIPQNCDGLDLTKLCQGSDTTIGHEYLCWWGGEQSAIRNAQYKYRWANPASESFARTSTTYEGVKLELGDFLYNLHTDPAEESNIIKDNPQIYEALDLKLELWKKVVGILE